MSNDERMEQLQHALDVAEQRINAVENTLGAITALASRSMTIAQREKLSTALARLGSTAETHGDMAAATLLTELHRVLVNAHAG